MDFKHYITDQFETQYGDKLRELWIKVAAEFGVEYEVVKGFGGKKLLRAKDQNSLMVAQFGSGTLNIPQGLVYDKIKKEFKKRAEKLVK